MVKEAPTATALPRSRDALLLGGPSGSGKTETAAAIGRRLRISWLRVNDRRLALEQSGAVLPVGTAELRYFVDTPDVWRFPPERLRDALIGAIGRWRRRSRSSTPTTSRSTRRS